VQALGLTRAGKPFGNQDLSRRQSREDRSVAGYRRDLKQGSGNIHESTRAARKFPEDARTARRSYRGRIYAFPGEVPEKWPLRDSPVGAGSVRRFRAGDRAPSYKRARDRQQIVDAHPV